MKNSLYLLAAGLAVGAFIAGLFYGRFKPAPASPQKLTLEQILSIKELHLVRHTYNDLFFLHKKNDPSKAIRAVVQVPVVMTAYLDLKEMKLVGRGDTIREVILPRARLADPHYDMENMLVRPTRAVQVHVGHDLYPVVSSYLQGVLAARADTVRHLAVANRILLQAEKEGREYILSLLRELGRDDVVVRFEGEEVEYSPSLPAPSRKRLLEARVDEIQFGFLPL
jgi:hypothetical protein